MSETAKGRKPKSGLPKLIQEYYAALKDLAHQSVMYEMGTRTAFHNLLAGAGRPHKWTLIPELERKALGKPGGGAGARTIRPDGTLKDEMNLVRGYWEAKDPGDDLTAEIAKKRKAGYPFNNIIFEDNRTALLFQHDAEVMRVDMMDPKRLAELIVEFFRYTEPQIEQFEHAVEEFKERVPDLAKGLEKKIAEAHKTNAPFKQAFGDFYELCKTSLNPNLSAAAVDEMLIQHILTERLIREIFDNPEFVRRNVIAAEVEKVMQAMTSKSFDRNTYLKELDRFYVAIEQAARTMTEWSDKQYFLNTVYERFFQGYSVKLADTMGIVYTPQAIVDFMCASVEEVLKTEFGKTLASDDVYIIDPCTGTGNFIVNLIRRIPKSKIEDVYKKRLFANEIMLLPYYIAALNIEHAYFEQTGTYEGFEGLCFVDTLDLALGKQGQLEFLTEGNSKRVERQKRAPITVVIGNPPYNVGQAVHNDKNQNRGYPIIDQRIRETYGKDSKATSVSKLSDAYVKFFRWASDRLHQRDGIVCYVSNNGFIDQVAFDGMRKHLLRDFTTVFHLDLEGNVRHDPDKSGTQYNVFGIQVGVGITIAVRDRTKLERSVHFAKVDKELRRFEKLSWIASHGSISKVEWEKIQPDKRHTWLIPENAAEFEHFIPVATKAGRASDASKIKTIFKDYSLGVATHRDAVVYDFNRDALAERVEAFVENYNAEIDRYKRAYHGESIDDFVNYDRIAWDRDLKKDLTRERYVEFSSENIRLATYRPFTRQFLYLDRVLNAEVYGFFNIFPNHASQRENLAVCCSDLAYRAERFSTLIVNGPTDLHLCATLDGHQCFPFYIYGEDGTRSENITEWALDQFRNHYKDPAISKWGIFDYVYGLLHHTGYRSKFADNLKRELPRIPFAPDFQAFQRAGQRLIELHVKYETIEPYRLTFEETPGEPLSYRVEDKMRLSKDKGRLVINKSLSLSGIPAKALEYRLGNRSALEWVIDQYQVHTDARSGITSDPNRADDPEYIVRLVGQVIAVSLETVAIVEGLPEAYSDVGKVSKLRSHWQA